jgi:Flp pilus assembly protein TadD
MDKLPAADLHRPAAMAAPRARTWSIALAVALPTALAFAPALRNGFVDLDDQANFVDNFHFRGLGPANLRWMLTTVQLGHWQPLSWLTLAVDHALWGLDPTGYHLTSLVWHAANAGIVYLLARRLLLQAGIAATRVEPAAALGALLWGVHPLRVESVAWATERHDVVSGCFLLLALLAYVARPGRGVAPVLGLAVLALMAKGTAMVLPGLLVVLDVYPLRRLGGTTGWWSAAARRVWREKLPFVALSAGAAAVALMASRRAGALRPFTAVPLDARVAAALYQPGFYLWKTLVPVGLLPVYEYPLGMGLLHPLAVAGAAVLTVLAALAWYGRTRWPAVGAVLIAYLVSLAPTLGLAQSGPQIAADRYTYVALVGWSVLAGAVVVTGTAPWRRVAAAAPVVAVLAILTAFQSATWRDPRTLWTRAVRLAPDCSFAQYRLADVEQRAGDREGAIRRLEAALALRPAFAEAQSDLGALLAASGRLDEALAHYDQALRANPRYAFAYTSLGTALAAAGRNDEALAAHRHALEIDPDLMEAHANLGSLLDDLGRTDEAMAEYQTALRLRPSAEVLNNVAIVLARQGRPAEAAERYREAIALRPELATIRVNLAYALIASGDRAAARQALEAALRLEPGNGQARAMLDGLGAQ